MEVENGKAGSSTGCSANHRNASFVLRSANWAGIRWIGELSILNRVSYLVLAIAPLLAVSWEGIRGQILMFNDKEMTVATGMKEMSIEIKGNLQRLSEGLDANIKATPTIITEETKREVSGVFQERARTLKNKLDTLEQTIDKFNKEHDPKQLGHFFPNVLTISYFAALVSKTVVTPGQRRC